MTLETIPTSTISVPTTSIMSVAIDMAASFSLTEEYTLYTFRFVVLLAYSLAHWYPLYMARRNSRDRDSLVKYFFKLSIIHSSVCFMAGLTCLLYTIVKYFDPANPLGKLFVETQFRECAYRFQELGCETVLSDENRRECFALGMCMVQPIYFVKLEMILDASLEMFWTCRFAMIGVITAWMMVLLIIANYYRPYWPMTLERIFWYIESFSFTNRIRGALDEVDNWYDRHFVNYQKPVTE
ncbi:hypothetical protein BUE80_DR002877 [Diplocarpon rosae]|nr:hypothetical protein BUE80_DR002877 [Diplocarpon rosae]